MGHFAKKYHKNQKNCAQHWACRYYRKCNLKLIFCTNIVTNSNRKLLYLYVNLYTIQSIDLQNYRVCAKFWKNLHQLSVLSLHDHFSGANSKFVQKHRASGTHLSFFLDLWRFCMNSAKEYLKTLSLSLFQIIWLILSTG